MGVDFFIILAILSGTAGALMLADDVAYLY